jgi:3-oxoisoapionate kinase
MSRHPVTPMHEADLRLHLAQQTGLKTAIANAAWPEHGIGLLDVHDAATQMNAGERLCAWSGGLVVGSSGVEYALVKALAKRGEIEGTASFPPLLPVKQTVVASGSVSPTTERQIRHAVQHGFETVTADVVALARGDADVRDAVVLAALGVLGRGKSPLIHTALGPATDVGQRLESIPGARKNIGEGLGAILKAVINTAAVKRVIVAGGDSSSHALGQFDIYALTTRMPLADTPGSPLCTAASRATSLNGIDIALKGGQVGADDYFSALRDGRT